MSEQEKRFFEDLKKQLQEHPELATKLKEFLGIQ